MNLLQKKLLPLCLSLFLKTKKVFNFAILVDNKFAGEIVLETFRKLNKEHGRTIILITHEHDVAEHADRIISLKDGLIINDTKK